MTLGSYQVQGASVSVKYEVARINKSWDPVVDMTPTLVTISMTDPMCCVRAGCTFLLYELRGQVRGVYMHGYIGVYAHLVLATLL